MDLAEKRKQLEAVRAARQAKQQVVEQYMTGRSANTSIAMSGSNGSSLVLSTTSPLPPPASPTAAITVTTTSGAARNSRGGPSAATATSGPLTPPPAAAPAEARKTPRSATPTKTTAAATATPAAAGGRTTPRPSTPSEPGVASKPSQTGLATPEPLIHVLSVGGPAASSPAPASPAPTKAKPQTPVKSTSAARETSAARRSVDPAGHATENLGGWATLQECMRGASLPRDRGNDAAPTLPVCVFNPAVVLGDVVGSAESSSRRRVVLDATTCLVPYDGANGSGGERASVWSVCVAAAYGATDAMGVGVGGSGGAGLGVGSSEFASPSNNGQRRGSVESGVAVPDGRAGAVSGGGGGAAWHSADAALEGVRASMECGFPWGSAAASQTAVPGSTMDAALRVAREAPGLVLAWFVVPLPPSGVARNEGALFNEASPSPSPSPAAAAVRPRGGDVESADYVTVVVPLVCDSEVMTLLAHPFQPSTLLGGTRCGRVVQWSVGQSWAQVEPRRLRERALATTGTATTLLLPPQRPTHSSFPSPQAHQSPVLRLAIHGDVSCHHLYSISQEGKVCTWSAWQPLHPTASCQSYLGIRPMGNIGVAARFVERPGTDAMTQVFIGTASGAVLVGANRDAKSIELQYYGPPRPVPTSTTVIKTLDVTATAPVLASATSGYGNTLSGGAVLVPASMANKSASGESSIGLGSRTQTAAPVDERGAAETSTGSAAGAGARPPSQHPSAAASAVVAPPPTQQPHRGRIVSMSLQTATSGLRGRDCIVSAATDGTCAAWFQRSAVPLEGFSAAVTSVSWSPTKPGVLAAGDASGLVTLWAVNTSIITPVGTVSLREASRRTRGSPSSDAVLWVVAGAGDAAAAAASVAATTNAFYGAADAEDDEVDGVDDVNGGDASLGQADAVGAAISSVFFSRDGRWLFASTACGYVYALRVSASLA